MPRTEDEQMEYENILADQVFETILDYLPGDASLPGVAFSLWIKLIIVLSDAGWTAEDLNEAVQYHVALEECGSMH